MKKVMNRIGMLAMLTMISLTATAQDAKVKVDLNESYTGGTITVGEEQKAVEGGTEITITVTPISPGGTRDEWEKGRN